MLPSFRVYCIIEPGTDAHGIFRAVLDTARSQGRPRAKSDCTHALYATSSNTIHWFPLVQVSEASVLFHPVNHFWLGILLVYACGVARLVH
jgi:hypothetical protein